MSRSPLPVILSIALLFLPACTQQPRSSGSALSASGAGAHAAIRSEAGGEGLVPRRSGLDAVAAAPALNLSGASVYVAPLEIDYRSQDASSIQPLGFRNRTLNDSERARLQQTMAQAFAENFLAPRGGRLAASSGAADYTLRLRLDNFYLPAPLEQTTRLRQVFSESVAYGTLAGTLYDRRGKAVLQFRDRREFGDTFTGSGGERLQRFSPPAFWGDMRMDLRRAFSSLDRSLR
ncbi:hypothetical protein SAMN04487965_2842 [Microbulbifer donghaiensis]|uniref:DUF3313 domain-containing protein n=1 Tax=Microbulbifer donghaiensis TaxID=494016 RepID=A0A1M5F9F4_9GAMM|nr:hypothetical protein [Microbulbifer donghaiensis]SHF88184.1 hypothetical protein SAMN04487965_2842 [Microbulbifer donghaiensis]